MRKTTFSTRMRRKDPFDKKNTWILIGVCVITGREGEANWTQRTFLAENSRMRFEAQKALG